MFFEIWKNEKYVFSNTGLRPALVSLFWHSLTFLRQSHFSETVWTGLHATLPNHVIRRRSGRPTPWFDTECRTQCCNCRRLERRFQRTNSLADRSPTVGWGDEAGTYRTKKEQYWLDRLEQCGRSSSRLWRSLSPFLGHNRDVTARYSEESFAE